MSYQLALEAAGFKTIEFKEFGSYQGEWIAYGEYGGETGFVEGYYGSCSGCDAFYAQFGYGEPYEADGKYFVKYDEVNEDDFKKACADYKSNLAEFGASYLTGGLYDKQHYANRLAELKEGDWFDTETKELCEWALSK